MNSYLSSSVDDTRKIASRVAPFLSSGDIVGLTGELGAGKSAFISFLVNELQGTDCSKSPTFSIINQYDFSSPTIYHIDLYRIEGWDKINVLGLEEILYDDGISLIEWFPRLAPHYPKEFLEIKIECNIDGTRNFIFEGVGKRGGEIMNKLQNIVQNEVVL